MNKFRLTLNLLAMATLMFAFAAIAQGQATRTWVSGVGDDVNPCSRTAPCKTYAGAISKTAVNGEISTLDPGGFGAVTITKSITIEGTQGQGYGSILHSGTTGVNIAYDSFSGEGLTQRTVRLRNLNINGSGGSGGNASSGLRAIRISGGANSANSEVFVEDCVIDGSFGSPGRGIEDVRTGSGATLVVSNTTIRNMLSSGISITGTANSKVIIARSLISNCGIGISIAGGPQAFVSDTVVSANAGAGIQADSSTIEVDRCLVSQNGGVGFVSNAGTIRVSNTTALGNGTGLASTSAGGAVSSYGNNQTGGVAFPSTPVNQT